MVELYHHGIKGQRWGIRRFQNEDGSLNAKGVNRYNKMRKKLDKNLGKAEKKFEKINKYIEKAYKKPGEKSSNKRLDKIKNKLLPKSLKYANKAKKILNKTEHKFKDVKQITDLGGYAGRVNAVINSGMSMRLGMIMGGAPI